ncbi:MAG: hypothetical protein M3430_21055 [Acidobacteriota bacterium]|nr:hypothetical protein [Acidobacteriota bacterium]
MAHLPLALPVGAQVVADAAYTFYEWEDALAERKHIRLLVGRKRSSERRDASATHDYKQGLRHTPTAFASAGPAREIIEE